MNIFLASKTMTNNCSVRTMRHCVLKQAACFSSFHPNYSMQHGVKPQNQNDNIKNSVDCPVQSKDLLLKTTPANGRQGRRTNDPAARAAMRLKKLSPACANWAISATVPNNGNESIPRIHSFDEKRHDSSQQKQESYCEGSDEDDYSLISYLDDVPSIVHRMKQSPYHERLQVQACKALAIMAKLGRYRNTIMNDGAGLECILAVLQNFSFSESVQHHGCRALVSLTSSDQDKDVKEHIIRNGGLSFILRAMKRHANHVDVQHYGCRALANLAPQLVLNTGSKNQSNLDESTQIILQAMRNHPTQCVVQHYACRALMSLSGDYPMATNSIDEDKLGSQVHVATVKEAILETMRSHPSNVGIQKFGSGALTKLTSCDDVDPSESSSCNFSKTNNYT